MANGAAESTSLVSKNVKLDGEIKGTENIKIEGTITGKIDINGDVIVGQTGIVEADIDANNVMIEGKVTGNVNAKNKVEIHPSGKLIGDCSHRSLDIKEGALFEGHSHMVAAPATPKTPGTSPTSPPTAGKGK